MRVPSNLLKFDYTSGDKFVYSLNYKYYQGYYYEFNNKFFAGKEFNINAPELLKADSPEINLALTQASTYTYGFLSKIKANKNNTKVKAISPNTINKNFEQGINIRYFAKQLNAVPILIKEIDKTTFEKIQSDSYYQTIQVENAFNLTEKDLDSLDKKMQGLKTFLNTDTSITTSSEEDGK